MARKVKFTSEKQEQFFKKYEECKGITEVAHCVGVTRQCVFNHAEKNKKFKEKIQEIENKILDSVENALYSKAARGDVAAIVFALCNRRPS
jgi:predicted DNA-binding protein YlxM (UPF0122 family)